MTSVDHDFDEILRRALHAAVDPIEPPGDGLERIHRRLAAPRLLRQLSLILTECADLAQLIAVRLEPGLASARARLDRWRQSAVAVLGRLAAQPLARTAAQHRGGGTARAWVRPLIVWLRPAVAIAGAVAIVVAGVYGLSQLKATLAPITLGTTSGGDTTGHNGVKPPGAGASILPDTSASPLDSPAVQPPSPTQDASPSASCTPTPTPSASPSGTPSPSASPTPSSLPTPTPSPSTAPPPTPTPTPTPTGTSSAPAPTPSTVPTLGALVLEHAAGTTCGQQSPQPSITPIWPATR